MPETKVMFDVMLMHARDKGYSRWHSDTLETDTKSIGIY